jgi:hypothetical protein
MRLPTQSEHHVLVRRVSNAQKFGIAIGIGFALAIYLFWAYAVLIVAFRRLHYEPRLEIRKVLTTRCMVFVPLEQLILMKMRV